MIAEFARILLLILILATMIGLQVILSNRKSRWPGLILPLTYFGFHAIVRIELMLSGGMQGTGMEELLFFLFPTNIPTLILLGIYYGCREKYRRQAVRESCVQEIVRMKRQDLE